jgi:hypothetical protein
MSENKLPNPARSRKVSAFASAKIDFSVRAEIGLEDVHALRPAWSEAQCMQFLRQYGDTIGREMAMSGAMALAVILEGGSRGN